MSTVTCSCARASDTSGKGPVLAAPLPDPVITGLPSAAAASVGSAMRASKPPISTVSSSHAQISTMTPHTGEGISVSTLSVAISTRGSSCATESPTFFNQRVTVPSATDSPSSGSVTETDMAQLLAGVRMPSRVPCRCSQLSRNSARRQGFCGELLVDAHRNHAHCAKKIWPHRGKTRSGVA